VVRLPCFVLPLVAQTASSVVYPHQLVSEAEER